MKTKSFFLPILLLFLTSLLFVSCSPDSIEDDSEFSAEVSASGKGSQSSPGGGGGGVDPDDDDL